MTQSFPTRRSSDRFKREIARTEKHNANRRAKRRKTGKSQAEIHLSFLEKKIAKKEKVKAYYEDMLKHSGNTMYFRSALLGVEMDLKVRSEENTSELQSPMRISYAVFCLKK